MIDRALAWTWAHKAGTAAMAASFILAWLAGYQPLVGDRVDEISRHQLEIGAQKDAFLQTKKLVINAVAYREQAASLPACDMPAKLDGKSYDRITRIAMDNGLQVVSLKVADTRETNEFFSRETPAELRLAGEYHQFGRFLEAQAAGRDHAVVEAMKIERPEGSRLVLTVRLHLVRLATDEEQAAGEKAAREKAKASAKKGSK